MNRTDLLSQYFNIDSSGNEIDGYIYHYVRARENLITKNKKTEFLYVMDTLIPEWREDGMIPGKFSVVDVDYREDQLCICTQCITDLCLLKHPVLPYSVQVGNVCVGKISPDLQREAEGLLRKKKKEIEEEKQRQQKKQWDDYNDKIKQIHLRLEKELDELIKKVEREHDEYIMRELFRVCETCFCYTISKEEPSWKIKCLTCYKKKAVPQNKKV
jgi:hypothetical protein